MLKMLTLSVSVLAFAGGLALAETTLSKEPMIERPVMSTSSSSHSTGHWLASDVYKAGVYAGPILLVDTARDHDQIAQCCNFGAFDFMLRDHELVSSGQAAMATVLGGFHGGGFHGGRFHGGGWGHHGPWGFGHGRWGWIWWRILQEMLGVVAGVFDRVFVRAEFKMLTLPSCRQSLEPG